MTMEAIEKIGNEAQKRNEAEFKKNKKNINFSLRGRNKYYYAYQCALFTKNVKIFGFGHISADMIINDGIKVRKDYLPAKKRYEDSGAKNPFHTKLRDGGIVSIEEMTRPLNAQR